MTVYWNSRKYTKDEFIIAWKNSDSLAECARKLGLTIYGSTHQTLKRAAVDCGLTQDHMTGQGWSKGKIFGVKRPIEKYLTNEFPIGSHALKQRLISEGFFERKCYKCNNFLWNNLPISLELEHIDGNHFNNDLNNLTILCCNCHAQTETWRKKKSHLNQSQKDTIKNINLKKNRRTNICKCGKTIDFKAATCKSCVPKETKIDWPTNEELRERLKTSNYSKLGRELGVSDNAIRKRLKREII